MEKRRRLKKTTKEYAQYELIFEKKMHVNAEKNIWEICTKILHRRSLTGGSARFFFFMFAHLYLPIFYKVHVLFLN